MRLHFAHHAACLNGSLDKHSQPEELSVCSSILMGSDRANCMAAAGTAPRQQGEERRSKRRARDDDDEDDDRRERTQRLTNFHGGVVSRFFWRLPDARRFKELELAADVATNQYLDLTLPDETLEVCIETPDGFRLHWERVRRNEALVIAANERNWAVGRCRELR